MNAASLMLDVLASAALLSGGVLAALAGLGLVRLPDVAARLQAATKPQVLGLALICVGVTPYVDGMHAAALGLVVLFQLTTAPVLAQLIGHVSNNTTSSQASLVVNEAKNAEESPEE